jgi:hypothetical protein
MQRRHYAPRSLRLQHQVLRLLVVGAVGRFLGLQLPDSLLVIDAAALPLVA